MYLVAIVFYVISYALPDDLIGSVLESLLSIFFGMFANAIYMKHIEHYAKKEKELDLGEMSRIEYQEKHGGTSVVAIFIFLGAIVALSFLAGILLTFLAAMY